MFVKEGSLVTLKLTMALSDYAHTRELAFGNVRPQGIDLTVLTSPFEQISQRFAKGFEWDVSEFSLAGYCAHVANGQDPKMVGIPVFPSRVFRQSSFFINDKSGIKEVGDLRGKRIGIPQWSQTATVYARGYLAHQVGIPLSEIDWIQAGVNAAGRTDQVKLNLPDGVKLTPMPEKNLSDMLASGEVDAIITARPPNCFVEGHPNVRRLFSDVRAVEEDYFRTTGIFPIMHVLVVRYDTYVENRWILRNLLDAFEEAKRVALPKMRDITTSFVPTAWLPEHIEETDKLFFPDGNIWPYGTKPNRVTLEAFLQYCFEQGVTERHLSLEEMFPPEFNFDVVV